MLRVIRVRNFPFVHPRVRIELVRLEDVGQTARLAETAKGQSIGGLRFRVFVHIRYWTRIKHQTRNALLGQDLCGHPTRMAGTND